MIHEIQHGMKSFPIGRTPQMANPESRSTSTVVSVLLGIHKYPAFNRLTAKHHRSLVAELAIRDRTIAPCKQGEYRQLHDPETFICRKGHRMKYTSVFADIAWDLCSWGWSLGRRQASSCANVSSNWLSITHLASCPNLNLPGIFSSQFFRKKIMLALTFCLWKSPLI
jgi:hypothetical protein